MTQKLSPTARRMKAKRDLLYAKSPYRKAAKADSQRKRRKKGSAFLEGKDYDHKTSSFKSIKANRGNSGQGTKKESGKNYKIKK